MLPELGGRGINASHMDVTFKHQNIQIIQLSNELNKQKNNKRKIKIKEKSDQQMLVKKKCLPSLSVKNIQETKDNTS